MGQAFLRGEDAAEVLADEEEGPLPFLATRNHSAEVGAEPGEVLREARDDQVGAELERPLAERGGERVVHDEQDAAVLRPAAVHAPEGGRDPREVEEAERRVDGALDVDDAGLRGDAPATRRSGSSRSRNRGVTPEAGHPRRQQAVGAAVEGGVRDQLVAGLQGDQEGAPRSRPSRSRT